MQHNSTKSGQLRVSYSVQGLLTEHKACWACAERLLGTRPWSTPFLAHGIVWSVSTLHVLIKGWMLLQAVDLILPVVPRPEPD
jgi:hypothetical protein